MEKPNNPPAFPFQSMDVHKNPNSPHEGMTLRDYFAAKAMQSFAAKETQIWPERFASNAYAVADAMLAEREKGNS